MTGISSNRVNPLSDITRRDAIGSVGPFVAGLIINTTPCVGNQSQLFLRQLEESPFPITKPPRMSGRFKNKACNTVPSPNSTLQ